MATAAVRSPEVVRLSDAPRAALRVAMQSEWTAWRARLFWESDDPTPAAMRALNFGMLEGAATVSGRRVRAHLAHQPSRAGQRLCSLYVSPGTDPTALPELVHAGLASISPGVRIEGQVCAFDSQGAVEQALAASKVEVHPRHYLLRDDAPWPAPAAAQAAKPKLRAFVASDLEACASVLVAAHARSVESRINHAFRSEGPAMAYLREVLAGPGCGEPVAGACLIAREGSRIDGFLLGTVISDGTGHVAQVAVRPEAQGRGLGDALFAKALGVLTRAGCARVTLSVSLANERARDWYARRGFEPVVRLCAVLREA